MLIILDAIKTFINLKQQEGEGLQEFTKRFKTASEMMKSHLGRPIVLTKYVKAMREYDPESEKSVKECNEKAFSQFAAYTYLENSDKSKYGSLQSGLQTQQSLKNNQYPQNITEANNVLSNHSFNNFKKTIAGKNQPQKEPEKNNNNQERPEMSFAMLEGRCYCCDTANSASSTSSQITTAETSQTSSREWSGAHIQMYQASVMKDLILLDNGLTVNLFCNQELVENIHETEGTLRLSTNGGEVTTKTKATVPGYGEDWFTPKAITNIFSLSEMEKKDRVTYDSNQDKAFTVYLPHKTVKFTKDENGLYYHKPTYRTTQLQRSMIIHAIDSVDENKKFYTERQVQKAKLVRQIYHALGTPSIKDFKAIVRANMVKNLPITTEDINIAENILGPDVRALKGKVTRNKPAPVTSDYIKIPKELIANHQHITLCMDGMRINGIPFLTTISKNIKYRTAEWIPNQTPEAYRSVLENVFRIYNKAGFRIKTIYLRQ